MTASQNTANLLPPVPYGLCDHLRPTDGLEEITWNPIRAAADIYRGIEVTLRCYRQLQENGTIGIDFYGATRWAQDLAFFNHGEPFDLVWLLLTTAIWTISRPYFINYLFVPLSCKLGVLPKNEKKFTESCWKLSNSVALTTLSIYVGFFGKHHLFDESMQIFSNWQIHEYDGDSTDLKLAYLAEASFYLHGFYATLVLDGRRSDTFVMCFHHFASLSLISFSYVIGFLKIGVLIFALDDFSDVMLELGRTTSYLRQTRYGRSFAAEVVSISSGIVLVVSWFFGRIVCHLTKVWRSASLGSASVLAILPVPFHIYFQVFLGLLYVMYVYWFGLMLSMIFSVILGKEKMSTLEDVRDASKDDNKKTE